MLGLIALLLLAWIALIVIGAIVKTLFWLLFVGVVLFLLTAGYGWVRHRSSS